MERKGPKGIFLLPVFLRIMIPKTEPIKLPANIVSKADFQPKKAPTPAFSFISPPPMPPLLTIETIKRLPPPTMAPIRASLILATNPAESWGSKDKTRPENIKGIEIISGIIWKSRSMNEITIKDDMKINIKGKAYVNPKLK